MMNKLLVALALGASVTPVAAIAQAPQAAPAPQGGRGQWMQHDVTRQQTQQTADSMFQQFDLNHDGSVTRAEAEQVIGQMAAARGDGAGGGRMASMIVRVFGNASSLTLAQFEAQALARFDAQDLNHDGIVTTAERQQARAQRGQ